MKNKGLLSIIAIVIITTMSAFQIYYSSGCQYHTGSPADGLTCNNCHLGGTITPSITISAIPAFGAGDTYLPGTTYTISVLGSGYSLYGFDLEILNSQSSIASSVLDFGTLAFPPIGETINTPAPGYTYSDIMHTAPRSTAFTVVWTAPASGTGYLYCALLGVNNNGATSGDKGNTKTMTLTSATANGIIESSENGNVSDLAIYPNPCIKTINLAYNLKESAFVHIELFNTDGAKVADIADKNQDAGYQEIHFDIPSIVSKGIYIIKMNLNDKSISKKVIIL
jgi:hypothetical protein